MSQQHRPNPGSTANRPEQMLTPTPGPVALAPFDAAKDIHRDALTNAGAKLSPFMWEMIGIRKLRQITAVQLVALPV